MLEFVIEPSVIVLPGASPKLSGSFGAAVLGDLGDPGDSGDPALTLAWRCSWSPALEPLFGFCCFAPLELGARSSAECGNSLGLQEGGEGRNSAGERGWNWSYLLLGVTLLELELT